MGLCFSSRPTPTLGQGTFVALVLLRHVETVYSAGLPCNCSTYPQTSKDEGHSTILAGAESSSLVVY